MLKYFFHLKSRYKVTIHVSGLHPYLCLPGKGRHRDFPDFRYVIQLEAYGYDDAVKKAMEPENLRGKGWSWKVKKVEPM